MSFGLLNTPQSIVNSDYVFFSEVLAKWCMQVPSRRNRCMVVLEVAVARFILSSSYVRTGYTLIEDKWGGCWLLIGKVEWSVNIARERVCPGPRHPAQQQQGRGTARRPSSDGDQLILQITFLVFLHTPGARLRARQLFCITPDINIGLPKHSKHDSIIDRPDNIIATTPGTMLRLLLWQSRRGRG